MKEGMRAEWNAAQAAATERSESLAMVDNIRSQMQSMASEMQQSYKTSVNALQDLALQALLTTPRENLLLTHSTAPLGKSSVNSPPSCKGTCRLHCIQQESPYFLL